MKPKKIDDICPRSDPIGPLHTQPHAAPIYPTTVWACQDLEQIEQIAAGRIDEYYYQRERHPNADLFRAKCLQLHQAEQAIVTSSGMAALVAALLSQAAAGDHLLVSNQLYGQSQILLTAEIERLGMHWDFFDPTQLDTARSAVRPTTSLAFVETIANPRLRVADIELLAEIVHSVNGRLLVDNTFATPTLCRPLQWGADLVMESVSKMMNGHSDAMIGLLAGRTACWERVPQVVSVWGLASSPFDSWLATRGLATMHLRMARACENAQVIAEFMQSRAEVRSVDYPGLKTHPDHKLAGKILSAGGTMVTFHLADRPAADRFFAQCPLPLCPSLGEVSTTLSHPATTSHRTLSETQQAALGISQGTIRLSSGIESSDHLIELLEQGLS